MRARWCVKWVAICTFGFGMRKKDGRGMVSVRVACLGDQGRCFELFSLEYLPSIHHSRQVPCYLASVLRLCDSDEGLQAAARKRGAKPRIIICRCRRSQSGSESARIRLAICEGNVDNKVRDCSLTSARCLGVQHSDTHQCDPILGTGCQYYTDYARPL